MRFLPPVRNLAVPDTKHPLDYLANQVDIGNAFKPYYGGAVGKKLTRLLKTHIKEPVPVLQAAKAGDRPALKKALASSSSRSVFS